MSISKFKVIYLNRYLTAPVDPKYPSGYLKFISAIKADDLKIAS